MPDCELLDTCPFFTGEFQEGPELTERLREEYCRGEYNWCGRYMIYKAFERERARIEPIELYTKLSDVSPLIKGGKVHA